MILIEKIKFSLGEAVAVHVLGNNCAYHTLLVLLFFQLGFLPQFGRCAILGYACRSTSRVRLDH